MVTIISIVKFLNGEAVFQADHQLGNYKMGNNRYSLT